MGISSSDQDNDGMADAWEERFPNVMNSLNDDSLLDPDNDGVINADEFKYGLNPGETDSDQDQLSDYAEIHQYHSNPANSDTDGGGLSDGEEIANGRNVLDPNDDELVSSSVTISLFEGWNLISLPISPTNSSISSVLASISGKYIIVWAYNNGRWTSHNPDTPYFNDLKDMSAGQGYWIKMKQSATLSVSGLSPQPFLNLNSGWNLVGYNSASAQNIENLMSSVSGKYISVWAFVNNTWQLYSPASPLFSDLNAMKPGVGYWINTTQECRWTLP